MVQIITDSSVLYTVEEAKAAGFEAVPLCVSPEATSAQIIQKLNSFDTNIIGNGNGNGNGRYPRLSIGTVGCIWLTLAYLGFLWLTSVFRFQAIFPLLFPEIVIPGGLVKHHGSG